MPPIPEPTIYDITEIPFFPWEPSSMAWLCVAVFAALALWSVFAPMKIRSKEVLGKTIPQAKSDALTAIESAILDPTEETLSIAASRAKRFFEGDEDLGSLSPSELRTKESIKIAHLLFELDSARYAPNKRERVIHLLHELKDRVAEESR